MLRCKNLFFFSLSLSFCFFFFPNSQFPPSVLSPTQWSEVHREQSSEKFRGAERLFSGAATPAALHTIRAREEKKKKITNGLHVARSCGVLFRMTGGARKREGEEPPRPSLSIRLRKHKAGPNNFIRLWNTYGQLKGHQRKSN